MIDYNKKRKQLLIKLDEGNQVDNMHLAMYDLTPYLKKETFNHSLTDIIIGVKNDLRPILHIQDRSLCFAPQQQAAFNFIDGNSRCIISAPTSFGKTLIVKEYIFRRRPRNIIYIVPTNALAYELENSFKKNPSFYDYEIYDRKKEEVIHNEEDAFTLFIGTQEKYIEIRENMSNDIDLFIIDEAYKLMESTKEKRGYKLSESFLDSVHAKSKKVVLLSPNAKFIGFDKFAFKEFNSTYNVVDKSYHQIRENDFYTLLNEKALESKTILYCDSPNDINSVCNEIQPLSTFGNELDGFVKFLEKEYHPDWTVVKLLKKGILVHHGQMPKYVQNKMINIFNSNKHYNLLVGTNSISEGINTPTKNIFLSLNSKRIQKDYLLLKNTIGRSGRLGEYPIGHIYSTVDIESLTKDDIEITLSISKKEEIEEIEKTDDDNKINELCQKFQIELDCYRKIRNVSHLSLNCIEKILMVLSTDQYADLASFTYMASKVFREYKSPKDDSYYIKGILQFHYKDSSKGMIRLNTFANKIAYFKEKNKESKLTNSSIVDGYMRFLYSSLDNYILPIVKIGLAVKDANPNWQFGANVIDNMSLFMDRYSKLVIGLSDYDSYTEEQKVIVQTLRDYGISISNGNINNGMISEIESELKIRYSCYDIINAIIKLSEKSILYKEKFVFLKNMYIS